MCLISADPGLYSFINQGVLTVDSIDDIEEMKITDVSKCGTPMGKVAASGSLHNDFIDGDVIREIQRFSKSFFLVILLH